MKLKICSLSKTSKWNDVEALSEAMSYALDNFFLNIYIPQLKRDSTTHAFKDPPEYEYINVGLSDSQISEVYNQFYGENYLIDPLVKISTDTYDYETSYTKLGKRIKAVLLLNKTKYLKLIELQGYVYNPLYNVDGTEEFTFLENQGMNDVKMQTNTYDGNLRDAAKTEYIHNNALNGNAEYSGGKDVFGNTVTGGDKYHTEKRVRQGNIGVTKTSELIRDERENVKFSIIEEFFKDINEQILVGIFD